MGRTAVGCLNLDLGLNFQIMSVSETCVKAGQFIYGIIILVSKGELNGWNA